MELKRYVTKWIGMLSVAVLPIGFLTSCAPNNNKEPEQVVELADDSWIMEQYFQGILDS